MIFIVTEKVHSYGFAYEYSVFSLKKLLPYIYIVSLKCISLRLLSFIFFFLNILDCLEKLF